MTTTIHSTHAKIPLTCQSQSSERVLIKVGGMSGGYDRAEFLAAVAAECDAIVTPFSDLPELAEWERELLVASNRDPAEHRRTARMYLAVAEWLDAHSPVDESQVDALTNVLDGIDAADRVADADYLARLLVNRGVTVKEADK